MNRILILTVVYDDIIRSVYSQNPSLVNQSYSEQKKTVDRDISIWVSGWENALVNKGWEVFTITINVKELIVQWAKENSIETASLAEIVFQQIKRFKPEILWYDYFDLKLINRIKTEIDSIKIILGWTGSAIVDYNILQNMDLVLSCAPEVVNKLNSIGIKSRHIHHAFNPLLLERRQNKIIKEDFIFIGQIYRGSDFHSNREKLLKELVNKLDLKIYSPTYYLGTKQIALSVLKKFGYFILFPLKELKIVENSIAKNNYLQEIMRSKNRSIFSYDRFLKKKMYPPVFGRDMYYKLAQSKLVLNVHADSSPEYASNMRLFETTGVGTCLLTDWKKNINDLFTDGEEILTYKSVEECIEKTKWILNNDEKLKSIGENGQLKTLKKHTYDSRVEEFLRIIKTVAK